MEETKLLNIYDRSYFDLLGQRRVFLSVLDLSLPLKDQGVEFLIQAFREAFPREDQSVEMIIYLKNPEQGKGLYRELSSYIEGDNRICYWDTNLSQEKITSLIACSDVFVKLDKSDKEVFCDIAEQFHTLVLNINDVKKNGVNVFKTNGIDFDLNEFSDKLKTVKRKNHAV